MPTTPTSLVSRWLAVLGERRAADLADNDVAGFEELVAAFSPPDLLAVPELGSRIIAIDGGVFIEFDARLVPSAGGDTSEEPSSACICKLFGNCYAALEHALG